MKVLKEIFKVALLFLFPAFVIFIVIISIL
jgi:hypothetical protein